jgi:AcrR family transcriptional regulator
VSIWTRETSAKPAALSREAIVRAAIKLADEEGLDAVSIRRIAAELSARPMSLYQFIERKDDLFDLMFDQLAGEALVQGELPGDWREALMLIAEHSREASLQHPWILRAHGRTRGIGPNVIRHVEQSLAALEALDIPSDRRHAILTAVDNYTLGHVTRELLETALARDDDTYVEQVIAGGSVPHIAAHGFRTLGMHTPTFREGLGWLLAGIEASLGLSAHEPQP